jgi:hypothetical protein
LSDADLLGPAGVAERVGRLVDALRVAAAAEVADRSRPDLDTARLSARKGCRSATELLERVTLASAATIGKRVRLGEKLRTRRTLAGSGWAIRMNHGAPGLQAPVWLDPTRTWRPATKSRTTTSGKLRDRQ